MSGLQKEFLLPFEEVVFSSLLPEPWVTLGVRSGPTQLWFICPAPQDTPLSALIQAKVDPNLDCVAPPVLPVLRRAIHFFLLPIRFCLCPTASCHL